MTYSIGAHGKQIKTWVQSDLDCTKKVASGERQAAITDSDSTNARILSLIKDLGNTVLTKTRAAELHK